MLTNAPVTAILPVVDMSRAKKFYEETLGLKAKEEPAQDHLVYECGQGTSLLIYRRGQTKADHTVAGFWVENLESEMADLRSRGVVFEEYDFPGLKTANGIATIGNEKSAWFKDTEGNILAVSQKI